MNASIMNASRIDEEAASINRAALQILTDCQLNIHQRLKLHVSIIYSLNLNNLFDDLFSVEEVKIYKPDSKVYDLPIKKYKIKPEEIIFLSANTWDVSGGGNYGYNSVWVNRNKSHFDNLDYHPNNEIGNLTQLLDIV